LRTLLAEPARSASGGEGGEKKAVRRHRRGENNVEKDSESRRHGKGREKKFVPRASQRGRRKRGGKEKTRRRGKIREERGRNGSILMCAGRGRGGREDFRDASWKRMEKKERGDAPPFLFKDAPTKLLPPRVREGRPSFSCEGEEEKGEFGSS